jgi:hypothetical protein
MGAKWMLQNTDQKLDEKGRCDWSNSRTGYCALLVEGCVFEGLLLG